MQQIQTSNTLATVDFHGATLPVFTGPNGERLTAMKPICEAIGLQWEAQLKRITRHPVLSKGMSIMDIPTSGGIQKAICLNIDLLNGWLFGVEASRVRAEVRDRLVQYQAECFDALAAYWQQGEAVNPRTTEKAEPSPHLVMEFARLAMDALPNLGDNARQCLLSHASEIAFGQRLIPLPVITEHHMTATEVGEKLGISAAMVGRLANANGVKVPEFGETRLDKSRHSSKQVESFVYNAAGLERLREILSDKQAA